MLGSQTLALRRCPFRVTLPFHRAELQKARHGHQKATVAVAHSILVVVYHLLERGEPYKELGGDYFIERQQKDAYQPEYFTAGPNRTIYVRKLRIRRFG
jgi:hypothetical protein